MLYVYLGNSLINMGSLDLIFLLLSTTMQIKTAATIINTMLPTVPKGIAIASCPAGVGCAGVGCAVGEAVWKMESLHHLHQ